MNLKKSLLCLSMTTLLSPLAAQADQPSYSFIDVGYVKLDLDDVPVDPDGVGIRASFDGGENWFLHTEYFTVDESTGVFDIDADQFTFGAGYKTALSDNTSFYATLDYLQVDVKAKNQFGGSVSEDEDGFGLSGGVRTMLSDNFELNAGLDYADVGDEDGFNATVGAAFYFTKTLGVVAEILFDDDSNRQYMIGGRLSF